MRSSVVRERRLGHHRLSARAALSLCLVSRRRFLKNTPRQTQASRFCLTRSCVPVLRVCRAKAFGEGVASDLELGDPVVLVGGDCDEAGLWEAEGAEVAVSEVLTVTAPVHQNHMQPRLITVHGAQDHVAVVVQQVVGEFEAVEGDDLFDPLRSSSRRVRVEVHSSRGGYISASSYQPRGAVEGVPVSFVINRNKVH